MSFLLLQVGAGEEKQKEGSKKKNKEGSGDGGRAEVNVFRALSSEIDRAGNYLRLVLCESLMVFMGFQDGTRWKNQGEEPGKSKRERKTSGYLLLKKKNS